MRSRRLLATGVTTLGVILIWVFASSRQEDQTLDLSRRWVGERWDIARRCVIGTPVGRSESQEEKADRLAAMAIEAVVAAEEMTAREEPDVDALWPARCVPLFRRLRVAPEVTGGDVSGPVGELEVLIARVIEMDDIARTMENARELAGPLHALDRGMPAGAEYDPTHFDAPSVDPAPIEASSSDRLQTTPRPFMHAMLGGQTLYDELDGTRLIGPDGYRRETPDAQTELTAEGLTFPRFIGDEIAWLVEGEAAIRVGERTIPLPFEGPVSAFAPCDVGEGQSEAFLVLVGERIHHVSGSPLRAHPLAPTPPQSEVAWACDAETAAVLWPAEADGRWMGTVCDASGCRALPPLRAGGDLEVAVGGGRALVVARGRRTDLRLWRELSANAWSAPTPVAFGEPSVSPSGLTIAVGEQRWTFALSPPRVDR